MNAERARQTIAEAALELGFDAVGWTTALVPQSDVLGFQAWIDAGFHAGMDYLEGTLERRQDLRSSFAPSRSVLVLQVAHAHPTPDLPEGGTRLGRVARYAWSPDYHAQLRPHLERLERIAAACDVQAKAYVDHGPILERGLAARAGLGWQGRSSQLISQRFGAFSTLAVLLCDLEAPETVATHPDRCGRCQACLPACPTDAITPARSIDSNRCIAYLTVEHRGPIPLEYRERLGDHLFGCDDCLDVCPWTTHAGPLASLLKPDPELAHPDIEQFFLLTGHGFERRYQHTAFARARRKGMARNAATVIGNQADPQHLWLLEHGLNDVGWEVREACAWALGRFTQAQAKTLLERTLQDPDQRVVRTAHQALERL